MEGEGSLTPQKPPEEEHHHPNQKPAQEGNLYPSLKPAGRSPLPPAGSYTYVCSSVVLCFSVFVCLSVCMSLCKYVRLSVVYSAQGWSHCIWAAVMTQVQFELMQLHQHQQLNSLRHSNSLTHFSNGGIAGTLWIFGNNYNEEHLESADLHQGDSGLDSESVWCLESGFGWLPKCTVDFLFRDASLIEFLQRFTQFLLRWEPNCGEMPYPTMLKLLQQMTGSRLPKFNQLFPVHSYISG